LWYNFLCGNSSRLKDGLGHGTHTAGIVSGFVNRQDSTLGINGVSKGAKIVPLKVLNRKGEGSWFNIVLALNRVARFKSVGDVVLMSLGGFPYENCAESNEALFTSIQNLSNYGIFIVMSAGNTDLDKFGNSVGENRADRNLPGCISGIPNVFTIAALDYSCRNPCNNLAEYSFLGSPAKYALPGTNIISTYKRGKYVTWSGTSMAAALMAGLLHSTGGMEFLDTTNFIDHQNNRYIIPKRK
jgi:subtilisin family serine protease